MSTAPIVSDLQKANPSAIIELFTLTTDASLHGSAQTYRFHNGSNLNNNGELQITYKDWGKWPPPKKNYQDNSGEMLIDIFMYEKQRENEFFNFLKELKKLNNEDENMIKVNL